MNTSVTGKTLGPQNTKLCLHQLNIHNQLITHSIDGKIGIFKAYFKFCHSRKGYKDFI